MTLLTKFLRVEEPDFPDYIIVKRSPRARRLALRLDAQKRAFNLVIPKGVSLRRAQDFAIDHDTWMRDKLRELPTHIPLKHGTEIRIFGKKYTIHVTYDKRLKTTHIDLKNNMVLVVTNQRDPHARLLRFLKKLAKEKLSELSHQKAKRIKKEIASIHVRDTKSRWGSCSSDGKLSYSWRLIFAPYESLDYVVAHEVAHLQHLDHSANFWALCRRLSDDFIEGQYWMRNFGHELMRYQ